MSLFFTSPVHYDLPASMPTSKQAKIFILIFMLIVCRADRQMRVKCYDNNMVKLPGCSFFLHAANQQQQKSIRRKTARIFTYIPIV